MIAKLVLYSFYLNLVLCSLTHYKASIIDGSKNDIGIKNYEALIIEAGKTNVDLLFLSPTKIEAEAVDAFDTDVEVVKVLSKAAGTARIYVVAQVFEKKRCQYRDEANINNMVFDRNGEIVLSYRSPVSGSSNCNSTESKFVKFTTDFGVTFALVTEEDIVLHRIEYFDGIKNFIVTGISSNIPELFAEQYILSWSFVNKVNVMSPSGLFGSNRNVLHDNFIIAEFQTGGGSSPLLTSTTIHKGLHQLHQNTKSLQTEANAQGYTDTVCDGSFCCNFYVKTSDRDLSVHYTISAYSDMVDLQHQRVSLQACAVSSKMHREIKFDEIKIIANFTNDSAQFPMVNTLEPTIINNIILENHSAQVYDTNLRTFGVLSIDYSYDEIDLQNETYVHSEYISYENVNDFFDYVWIRVRILMFIVSIYILEML